MTPVSRQQILQAAILSIHHRNSEFFLFPVIFPVSREFMRLENHEMNAGALRSEQSQLACN
jgi:hypothetical protein